MALKNKVYLPLLTVFFFAVLIFLVWNNQKVFIGDSTKNQNAYILEFERMNQKDSYMISACKDDEFSVIFRIDKGHADLIIEKEGAAPIFRGNDIETGAFEVVAPENGEYKITINARHAAGFVEVYAKKGAVRNHDNRNRALNSASVG